MMDIINLLFSFWLQSSAFSHFMINLLFIGGAFVMLAMLVTILLSQHARQLYYHSQQTQQISDLFSLLSSVNNDIKKLHKRYHLTEMALTKNSQKFATIERALYGSQKQSTIQTGSDKENVTYNFAMKLLQEGNNIEDIMRHCDLSEGEADILNALYGKEQQMTQDQVLAFKQSMPEPYV